MRNNRQRQQPRVGAGVVLDEHAAAGDADADADAVAPRLRESVLAAPSTGEVTDAAMNTEQQPGSSGGPPGMIDGPLPASRLRKFQTQTREALLQVLRAPEYGAVWCTFVESFEYRRQFPWLDESGRREQGSDGLRAALRDALEIYDSADPLDQAASPGKAHHSPQHHSPQHRSPRQEQPPSPLSSVWVERLTAATMQVTGEDATMQGFARALVWGGVDLDRMTPDVLRAHLVRALEGYAEQREIGVYRAPF